MSLFDSVRRAAQGYKEHSNILQQLYSKLQEEMIGRHALQQKMQILSQEVHQLRSRQHFDTHLNEIKQEFQQMQGRHEVLMAGLGTTHQLANQSHVDI